MFNIDLSFFKSGEFQPDQLELLKNNSNSFIRNIVIESANEQKCCEDCEENLDNIEIPEDLKIDETELFEARCSGILGDHFCQIKAGDEYKLNYGDYVVIRCEEAVEISLVKEIGPYVKYKREKVGIVNDLMPTLDRKATEEDLIQYTKNCEDEESAKVVFRKCVEKFNLNMKLVGIHYQFDRKKLYFFYTSDGRVDFRELAKELASIFKTRIELRQIGVRDEAKKVGGLGSCGREYCCSSFLDNFKRITTQIATDQNLSTNMSKLSGPCGKLKCCLSYEVE